MIKRLLLLLIILPLWGQAGPVYKWVDEKGVVHFSTKPHHEAEDVETLEASESPRIGGESNSQKDSENSEETSDTVEEVVENNAPTPEQIEYCKILKNNLKTLKSSPRVRMKKENGEFEILGDNARQAEIDRIEKSIKETCE